MQAMNMCVSQHILILSHLGMHLVAELSNPFLIIRTIYKIKKVRGSWLYDLNERVFAGSFLLMRLVATPILLVFIYEADNCIYSTKLCISLVMYL